MGGGGKTPNVPTRKKYVYVTYMRERAPQKYMYFQVSKYICIYTYIIQSMQWYGTINDSMTDETLTLRKIYGYASERSARAEFLEFI